MKGHKLDLIYVILCWEMDISNDKIWAFWQLPKMRHMATDIKFWILTRAGNRNISMSPYWFLKVKELIGRRYVVDQKILCYSAAKCHDYGAWAWWYIAPKYRVQGSRRLRGAKYLICISVRIGWCSLGRPLWLAAPLRVVLRAALCA